MEKDGTVGIFIIDEKLNIIESTGKTEFFYEILNEDEENIDLELSFFDERGITKIELPNNEPLIYNNNKNIKGIKYTIKADTEYTIKVTLSNSEVSELQLLISPLSKVKAEMEEKLTEAIQDILAKNPGTSTLDDITEEKLKGKLPYETTVIEDVSTGDKIVAIKKDDTTIIYTLVYAVDEEFRVTETVPQLYFSYKIIEKVGNNVKLELSFSDIRGITKIELPGQEPLTYDNKKTIKIEYIVEREKEYHVTITPANGSIEERKIYVYDYYDVKVNLQEGVTIDNTDERVIAGTAYEATFTVPDDYILNELIVTMGGTKITKVAQVNVTQGKISIPKVTGDIEITATKGTGTYIVKNGVLLNDNYTLFGRANVHYLEQKEGFVECKIAGAVGNASGISWKLASEGKNYSKIIFRLSNPWRGDGNAAGGFVFAGTTPVRTGKTYANTSLANKDIGANGYACFSTPVEYRCNFKKDTPESFYIGIQCYYRENYAWARIFNIYDIILVE